MQLKLFRSVAFSILLLVFSLVAQAALNLSDPIPMGPQVKVGKLDNGLTYYIQKNAKPEKRVEMRLVVKVGSIMEDDDQQGLAHFTEHMAFNGSRHFKRSELVSFLESIGMKMGHDLNAYTSADETVYTLTVPTTQPENLEKGFLVLQDWAQGVQMTDAAIDNERGIVLEELRMRKGLADRLQRQVLPTLYNGTRYANRLPGGKEEIIKTFNYDTLRRFYADWYRPNLMAVVVVGDIEPEQAEAMVRANFAELKNPANERPRVYTPVPPFAQSKALVITDSEMPVNLVNVHFPAQTRPTDKTLADVRRDIVDRLASAMLSERLSDLTQKESAPFLQASVKKQDITPTQNSLVMSAVLSQPGLNAAVNAVVQEAMRAQQFGFSADELERAKKSVSKQIEDAYNARHTTASGTLASEYTRNFLVGEAIPGIANEYAYLQALMPGLTVADVRQYARDNLPVDQPQLAIYIGSAKETALTPTPDQLLAVLTAAKAQTVVAQNGKALPSTLMATPPQAGSIVAQEKNAALGLTTLTLSNGVKVVLKPTDFKADEVLIRATRFGGQSLYGDADAVNARFATMVADNMGLASFTPADVGKVMAGKSATLRFGMDLYSESVNGGSTRADIATALQLLHLKMTAPRKDVALFKTTIEQAQSMVKNMRSEPNVQFGNFVAQTLYSQHPRVATSPTPEEFGQISLDRSADIYRERFGNAHGLTLVIVGSFDIDAIKPLLATYVASLPVTAITTSYKDLGIRPVTGVVKQALYVGKEDKAVVQLVTHGPANFSVEEAVRLQSLLDVVNLRITAVLREKLTLIYGGGMGGSIQRVPYGHFQITAQLPCAPNNVDKVVDALFGEIDKLQAEGPSAEEMNKVKTNQLNGIPTSARTNGLWADRLVDAVLYGTDPALALDTAKRVQRLERITAADIQEAAKRYLKRDNVVQMTLMPATKAP